MFISLKEFFKFLVIIKKLLFHDFLKAFLPSRTVNILFFNQGTWATLI